MNDTIKILCKHRTYRNFDSKYKIKNKDLNLLFKAARQASSWMNGQHYSIINIRDKELRKEVANLQTINPQVLDASVFLIFIGDLYRMSLLNEKYNKEFIPAYVDNLITITTDASLAAQNMVIAAESMGLGICYCGGTRYTSLDLIKLLNLPKYTIPLFGLCIGKPNKKMKGKPRIGKDIVIFDNKYETINTKNTLEEYEKTLSNFNDKRKYITTWGERLANYYEIITNPTYKEALEHQGLI